MPVEVESAASKNHGLSRWLTGRPYHESESPEDGILAQPRDAPIVSDRKRKTSRKSTVCRPERRQRIWRALAITRDKRHSGRVGNLFITRRCCEARVSQQFRYQSPDQSLRRLSRMTLEDGDFVDSLLDVEGKIDRSPFGDPTRNSVARCTIAVSSENDIHALGCGLQ